MNKRQHRRKALGQNFLKEAALVRRLVAIAQITKDDTVYEIGPGKGIITSELARVAKEVVAVEKDPRLALDLRTRFKTRPNVHIRDGDFLQQTIRINESYKIFANIPFNATTEIVRKIVNARPAPVEAFLVLQKEAAQRFAGRPHETLFSLQAKPCCHFQILHRFRRTDFFPAPNVDAVLLQIHRREHPLLASGDSRLYRDFVAYGFAGWNRNLRATYKRVFTYAQWKRLTYDLKFPVRATPTELSFEQWLGFFQTYKFIVIGKMRRDTNG